MAIGKKVDFYKNARLEKAGQGYIVRYTQYSKNEKDTYDGMNYIGEKTEVFEDNSDALAALEAIASHSGYCGGDEVEFKAVSKG
jgi:hypothetical protein